ncbi:hypothetical protein ABIE51_001463 [Lysobacter sp. OAE881]|uniref:hypothetical protein n=1 Tax=Lysobacter sp. OAE881 TaxID=2663813 RepID=UPI00178B834F
MRSNFLGGAYTLRSHPLAAQTCINLYVEPNESGSGEPGAFYGTPGLTRLSTLTQHGCRAMHVAGGYLWAVYGNSLYRFGDTWAGVLVGTIPSFFGPVEMADNGTSLVVAHPDGWHSANLSTGAMAAITDSPQMSDVTFIDNYLLGANTNGTYQWANLNSTTIDALNFASAEGSPDKTIRTLCDHRELWLFGTNSIEVAVVSGDPDLPFTRTTFIEQGILAPHSAAKEDNSVFWLGANDSGHGVVYVAEGYTPRRISTFAIEQAIAGYANPEDATAYTYQQDGHHFYVLNFAEATWAYDINSGVWAQRAWREPGTGELLRHRGNAHAFHRGTHVLGDFEDGRLYKLDIEAYTDDGDPIYRERTWPQVDTENKWSKYHFGELIADMGVGNGGRVSFTDPLLDEDGDFLLDEGGEQLLADIVSEPGADPKVWLQWSDDGGQNWSSAHERPLGQIGQFRNRAIWRRMGQARTRYYRLWTAEPVRIAWRGFNLNNTDVANG